jgi:hypothetical protein
MEGRKERKEGKKGERRIDGHRKGLKGTYPSIMTEIRMTIVPVQKMPLARVKTRKISTGTTQRRVGTETTLRYRLDVKMHLHRKALKAREMSTYFMSATEATVWDGEDGVQR